MGKENESAVRRSVNSLAPLLLFLIGVVVLYDIQKVEHDKWDHPVIRTDLISSSKYRIYNRVMEITGRRQQCRVMDQQGRLLSSSEIHELR